jgi:hypothetical protein
MIGKMPLPQNLWQRFIRKTTPPHNASFPPVRQHQRRQASAPGYQLVDKLLSFPKSITEQSMNRTMDNKTLFSIFSDVRFLLGVTKYLSNGLIDAADTCRKTIYHPL